MYGKIKAPILGNCKSPSNLDLGTEVGTFAVSAWQDIKDQISCLDLSSIEITIAGERLYNSSLMYAIVLAKNYGRYCTVGV